MTSQATTTDTSGVEETQRVRRGHRFYPVPADALPPLYATEDTDTADKTVGVHYFVGACDWWVVEHDPAEHLAFGYVCLGDPASAEWGYIHLPELETLNLYDGLVIVERDLDWTPQPFGGVILNAAGDRANTHPARPHRADHLTGFHPTDPAETAEDEGEDDPGHGYPDAAGDQDATA